MLTMKMRWLSVLFAAVAFAAASSFSAGADGLTLLAPAQAAGDVDVSVTVAKGTKGGSGLDKSLSAHKGTLELIAGYGAWAPAGTAKLTVGVGGKQSKSFGKHTFEVKAESVSGGKAKTVITVKDSNGSPNTMRSSLGNGGSTVVMMRSADGKQAHAYIVKVKF
jgi:hypothetical protein